MKATKRCWYSFHRICAAFFTGALSEPFIEEITSGKISKVLVIQRAEIGWVVDVVYREGAIPFEDVEWSAKQDDPLGTLSDWPDKALVCSYFQSLRLPDVGYIARPTERSKYVVEVPPLTTNSTTLGLPRISRQKHLSDRDTDID